MGSFNFFERILCLNRIWGNFYMNGLKSDNQFVCDKLKDKSAIHQLLIEYIF